MFHVPEKYRLSKGPLASYLTSGNNGAFMIRRNSRTAFFIIASDGNGWEHVSVHCESEYKERTPTWAEMCYIKDLFWDSDDVVIQYHPAKSEYVNLDKHTLHLWRKTDSNFETPPIYMV